MNQPSSTLSALPRLTLQDTREKSLKRLHPWIFSKAVKHVSGNPADGQTVEVVSSKGEWLGYAAYSAQSQIRARVWSFDPQQQIDAAFFQQRIARAWQLRTELFDLSQTNGLRVVAAESDGLPGITIDKYDTVLVCQLLSAGADAWRSEIVQALVALFPQHSIYERSDVDVRKKEGLKPVTGWLHLPREHGEVIIKEHGMSLLVDVIQGHKTGFYLDQRASRAAAKRYAK
ncbi:MAG: 23S rRNA (cytosine(1962)-C(5))-methyltransferase RlmI, partial [Gammaproteobacteria bacterium]|nr:23S rRNA (cytosine(1962)-C(5))-methyltransferase RlmI [Gammaproteobacteria bacterium]MBU1555508.1 23S rRNA (cytosine(1962)-C(5))-methyltransferase RlmI [Gammaproteobacteria bacterium]